MGSKQKKDKVIKVTWTDAFSSHSGWIHKEELPEWESDDKEFVITQVGFITKETPKYITLITAYSHQDVQNIFKIPKKWIRKRKILK